MAQFELPKEIASVSGAVSKRKNYDGSVTVTYFKTVNGKSRLYTHTYKPKIPNEKQCKVREALAKASKDACLILKHKCERDVLDRWEDAYQNYIAHVSPVDKEKNRFKTFKGFIVSQLFKSYMEP